MIPVPIPNIWASGRTVIRSVLRLKPRPGASRDIVELFEQRQIVEIAMTVEGCQGVELWESDDEILVMATWDDSDAYATWLDHPARNTNNAELNDLLLAPVTSDRHGGQYELALGSLRRDGEAS